MTKGKSGGPAFPLYKAISNEEVTYTGYTKHDFTMGMTLRDYFAAQALQGLLANSKLQQHILKEGGAFGGWIEHSAYGWADAMLKARDGET